MSYIKLTIEIVQLHTLVKQNVLLTNDRRNIKNCDTEKNEIAKHCCDKDHIMDWKNKKVIDQEQNSCSQNKKKQSTQFMTKDVCKNFRINCCMWKGLPLI